MFLRNDGACLATRRCPEDKILNLHRCEDIYTKCWLWRRILNLSCVYGIICSLNLELPMFSLKPGNFAPLICTTVILPPERLLLTEGSVPYPSDLCLLISLNLHYLTNTTEHTAVTHFPI